MRLHRFYVPEAIGVQQELVVKSAELANQLHRVLRLKAGDKAVLFDGSGRDFACEIVEFVGKDSVSFKVLSSSPSRYAPARRIVLCAAVVKKDNFELIAEKATELGVTDLIPLLAEHSEKKGLNEKRLAKITVEASEQSGRGAVPSLHAIVSLEEAIEFLKHEAGVFRLIAFHTNGEKFAAEKDIPENEPIAAFIGPEGGWSDTEIALFHKHSANIRCLGPQVLRAETAAVAALSQVVFRA